MFILDVTKIEKVRTMNGIGSVQHRQKMLGVEVERIFFFRARAKLEHLALNNIEPF